MAMAACLALVFTGCGAPSNDAGSSEAPSAASSEEISMGVIGEQTGAEGEFVVELGNGTGQDIVEFSIVENGAGDAAGNMLPEGEVFANGETRALYFTPAAAEEADPNADANEPALDPQYDACMKFADGTEAVMHAFPFGDMEAGTLSMEEGIVFVTYTSAGTGEEVSTLEAEKAAIEQAKAAEEQAAKAASEQKTEQGKEAVSDNKNNGSSSGGSKSSNNSGSQNSSSNNNSSNGNQSSSNGGDEGGSNGGSEGSSGGSGGSGGGSEGGSGSSGGSSDGGSGGGEGGCIGDDGLVY